MENRTAASCWADIRWRSPLPPTTTHHRCQPARQNRRCGPRLTRISLFSIGVTCRFSSSQSPNFHQHRRYRLAIPADAQDNGRPSTSYSLAMYSPVYSPGLSFQVPGSYLPITASTTSGRAAWRRRQLAVGLAQKYLTCLNGILSESRAHVPRSLVGTR